MLIEQIVGLRLRGPGPAGLTCIFITGYFHNKTKISKENLRVSFRLLLECCTRQCTLLPPTWTKSRHVGASLDKTLYDNYLCLVASNKQQIYVGRSQNVNRKAWKMVNS